MVTNVRSESAIETPRVGQADMKLEVVVISVLDVDRAKRFYSDLGWKLEADFIIGDEFRVVQFTPPGSSCSVHFGTGLRRDARLSTGTLSRRIRYPGRKSRACWSRC